MIDDSYVEVKDGTTVFHGEDATNFFAAVVVRSAMSFYLKTGLPVNRAYSPTNMRLFAEKLLHKPAYKRSEKGLAQAGRDLDAWIAAMKAALPVKFD